MLKVLTGPTIAANEFESDAIDVSEGQLVAITMPDMWYPPEAPITFLISADGDTFHDMFGLDGFATTVNVVVPEATVVVPQDAGRAIGFLKIRSGTKFAAVEQKDDREFSVTVLVADTAPAPQARATSSASSSAKARR